MSFMFDDAAIGGQFRVGQGICPAIGEGVTKINGSMHAEGPSVFGNPMNFPTGYATVNIGALTNDDPANAKNLLPNPLGVPVCIGALPALTGIPIVKWDLAVAGNTAMFGQLNIQGNILSGGNIVCEGEVASRSGGHILSAKKNFDIPHPNKEGYRLRHTCPEGPSNDVYFRGKLKNQKEISLPPYWENFVDPQSITVNITPIGAHQNIIVKRIGDNKIYLQSSGGLPIHCYYHVFGERIDGERLIPEYKGETPADYPGNNSEYSVSGYHYDTKE